MHTVYVLYTVRMCDVWDGAGVCIRYTICILHVCATYGMERVYAYGIRYVYCTYVRRMGWSACMHTGYVLYIVRMLDVCRCIRYTICISYVCRVYADAYGGIGMYGMYVATYACIGRVPVVYALCMGSPAHTLYTHSHTSHIQSDTGIYMYR